MRKPEPKQVLNEVLQEFIDHLAWGPSTPTPAELIDEDMQELVRLAMIQYAKRHHNYMIFKSSKP